MRGSGDRSPRLFSYSRPEDRIAANDPLRAIRALVDHLLSKLSGRFGMLYAAVWDASTFSKDRDSLFTADVAREFLTVLIGLGRVRWVLSSDHSSVYGTMNQAWASMKSFRPKDGSSEPPGPHYRKGRNGERDFCAKKCSYEAHASTTDADARLFCIADGQSSRLCYLGHDPMDHRQALIVNVKPIHATGTAESAAALAMIERTRKAGHGGHWLARSCSTPPPASAH